MLARAHPPRTSSLAHISARILGPRAFPLAPALAPAGSMLCLARTNLCPAPRPALGACPAPRPARARCAPAWPRRAAAGAAQSWKDKAWKDRTTFRGQRGGRGPEDEDREGGGQDAPAPAAKDEAAVGMTVADSMATAVASTVAMVAATMSQPAVQGTGARVSSGLYDRANAQQACIGRHRAGKRAGEDSPVIRRDSVALVMLVAGRGRCQCERSARR